LSTPAENNEEFIPGSSLRTLQADRGYAVGFIFALAKLHKSSKVGPRQIRWWSHVAGLL